MTRTTARLSVLCLAPLLLVGAAASIQPATDHGRTHAESGNHNDKPTEEAGLNVHYLEIVTPSVNETCDTLAETRGVVFGDPVPELGNARTADLAGGGRLGVRAPMHDGEEPVVRPYILVDDIEAAVKAAEKAGAKVAVPPMQIPGQGTISIYLLGGIEHGLWQR